MALLAAGRKNSLQILLLPFLATQPGRCFKSVSETPDSSNNKDKSSNKQRYWRYPKKNADSRQIYDFFLVLDFEATCLEDKKIEVQEIIEFPCIKVNGVTLEQEAIFHQYVLPTVNPELSHFCTKLTGITQEMLDGQCNFKDTIAHFHQWLVDQGLMNNKTAFVTSGNWDLQFLLPHQCRNEQIPVPKYFSSWINIKQSFADANGHYPRGIIDMMKRLNLKHCGRLHSGIDDCRNLTKILQKLAFNGHILHKSGFALPSSIPAITKEVEEKK